MHTPGPWFCSSGMVWKDAQEKVPIAQMDREPGNGTQPCERDANARLIAAAPELLEVAKFIKATWDEYDGTAESATDFVACLGDPIAELQAAIRKAEGKG